MPTRVFAIVFSRLGFGCRVYRGGSGVPPPAGSPQQSGLLPFVTPKLILDPVGGSALGPGGSRPRPAATNGSGASGGGNRTSSELPLPARPQPRNSCSGSLSLREPNQLCEPALDCGLGRRRMALRGELPQRERGIAGAERGRLLEVVG